jgi:hypothetical protein
MTKPLTPKDKRLRAFERTMQQRRERLGSWLSQRDAEEVDLLAYLCEGYHNVHDAKGRLIGTKPQPVVSPSLAPSEF